MLIIITFPNRTLSWFQIGSVAVSSFMTLWTAANLFQLKLETENKETMLIRALKKVRAFSLTAPLILTSLVFNFSNIILGIINNNFFFVLYMFSAFFSILLPATFSPAASIEKLEKTMRLDEDNNQAATLCGLNLNCGRDGGKKKVKVKRILEGSDQIRPPPRELKDLMQNTSRAINLAYTNVFCITKPIVRDSASVRHFMVGLYPLHFVVNITSLVFERYFSNTDVITIRGQTFNYNNVVLLAILIGLANFILFILFYYPNFFDVALRLTARKTSALATKSMEKENVYKVAEVRKRAEKQVRIVLNQSIKYFPQNEILKRNTYKRHKYFDSSDNDSYI